VGCCRSRYQPFIEPDQNTLHSKKENRLNRVSSIDGSFDLRRCALLFLILILLSIGSLAQSAKDIAQPSTRKSSFPTASVTDGADPVLASVSVAQLRIPAKAVKHLESAQKRFSNQDMPGTMAEIGRALRIDPKCARAFSLRSFVKLAENDSNGAIEDAVRAVALDPHDAESYLALATAYNDAKEFSNAAEAARQAVSTAPNAWQGRLELAKSLYGQGQYVPALGALNMIHKDFPDVHLVRADVLIRLERTGEAAEEFKLFMKQAPNDPRDERIMQIVAHAQPAPAETGHQPE
jgi:tetratricopeptide (TPR) repeat protein